jgi:hypothetical protein
LKEKLIMIEVPSAETKQADREEIAQPGTQNGSDEVVEPASNYPN